MSKPSLLEQTTERVRITDYDSSESEAYKLLKMLNQTLPKVDLRQRKQIFQSLISQDSYEGALQMAWGLLAHPKDKIAKVGEDLLHRLIDYKLVEREYLSRRNQQAK